MSSFEKRSMENMSKEICICEYKTLDQKKDNIDQRRVCRTGDLWKRSALVWDTRYARLCQKNHVSVKRDLYKRPACVKRDLYKKSVSRKRNLCKKWARLRLGVCRICEKRPAYVKRDIHKRPACVKGDLYKRTVSKKSRRMREMCSLETWGRPDMWKEECTSETRLKQENCM